MSLLRGTGRLDAIVPVPGDRGPRLRVGTTAGGAIEPGGLEVSGATRTDERRTGSGGTLLVEARRSADILSSAALLLMRGGAEGLPSVEPDGRLGGSGGTEPAFALGRLPREVSHSLGAPQASEAGGDNGSSICDGRRKGFAGRSLFDRLGDDASSRFAGGGGGGPRGDGTLVML